MSVVALPCHLHLFVFVFLLIFRSTLSTLFLHFPLLSPASSSKLLRLLSHTSPITSPLYPLRLYPSLHRPHLIFLPFHFLLFLPFSTSPFFSNMSAEYVVSSQLFSNSQGKWEGITSNQVQENKMHNPYQENNSWNYRRENQIKIYGKCFNRRRTIWQRDQTAHGPLKVLSFVR